MTSTLPADQRTRVKECFLNLRSHYSSVSIRGTVKAIGYIISCLPAIPFGGIHYRALENDKIQALKMSKGNIDAPMTLSKLALSHHHHIYTFNNTMIDTNVVIQH